MKLWAAIIVFVLFISAAIYVQASIWEECRTDHSVIYCMRLISR